MLNVLSFRGLFGPRNIHLNFVGKSPRNLGYAHEMRTNNNVSMTWVPWSGHGMTEFFAKILFINTMLNFYLSKKTRFSQMVVLFPRELL